MSPEHEFHRDLDDHVDGLTQSACGCELPLPDRLDRALVEAGTQSASYRHVRDRAVAVDDDFEEDISRDAAPAGVIRVLRLDLMKQPWRLDSASRSIRSATESTAGPRPDPRTAAFAIASATTGPGATANTCSRTVRVSTDLLGDALMLLTIGRRCDRCDQSS
jgi:hypothetical protein